MLIFQIVFLRQKKKKLYLIFNCFFPFLSGFFLGDTKQHYKCIKKHRNTLQMIGKSCITRVREGCLQLVYKMRFKTVEWSI